MCEYRLLISYTHNSVHETDSRLYSRTTTLCLTYIVNLTPLTAIEPGPSLLNFFLSKRTEFPLKLDYTQACSLTD